MIAAYRFLNNEHVPVHALEGALVDPLAPQLEGRHVLLIQDTTEINYAAHGGRLQATDPDLGPVGNNQDVGFFLHPTLALDADSGLALGLADVHLWNRRWDKLDKHERAYRQQPIERKESYRWIEAAEHAVGRTTQARQRTIIADREADIYDLFCRLPAERTDLLIRACRERRIDVLATGAEPQRCLLSEHLASLERAGQIEIEIRGNNGRKKRTARLAVRFSSVRLRRPAALASSPGVGAPETVEVRVVEVGEVAATVPEGEAPIRWCLLTTHPVETLSDALRLVSYYKKRWQIEQLFRLLKSEGLDVEASQLRRGSALKKLVVLSLQVALVSSQLVTERDGSAGAPASLVFSRSAMAFLRVLQPQLGGKTQKQQCPHAEGTLAWSSWVIGRLGGWKGYSSQSPPGPITMRRGLERFAGQYAGWSLAQGPQRAGYA